VWPASGIAWVMAEGAEGWLAFAAFAAIPLAILVVYGWLYNRGHVDLLRTPR
jgi:lipoprotein signal peptidase